MSAVGALGQNPACMMLHCGKEMLTCGTDAVCRGAMMCFATCGSDTSCDFNCEQKAYGNMRLHDFMQCSADHGCLAKLGPDCAPADQCRHGQCNATDAEAVANLTSLEQLKGEWWTLTGVNPHYDYYFCQHEHIAFNGSDWIDRSTYGIDNSSQRLASIMKLSMPAPGVVRHDYTDAALSPNVEDWRFVSFPHPDWAFVLWCGHNPIHHYSGGFVLSRSKDIASMPQDVRAIMKRDVQKFGLDLDELHVQDNSACPKTSGVAPSLVVV
jgi:hypothetical protein